MLQIQNGLTKTNFNKRGTNPTWIVLHYTANNGDTAYNNISYFMNEYRGASANYFVDRDSIWRCVADTDTAWHVGNDTYKNGARNYNSIGIEMCSYVRSGGTVGVLQDYRIHEDTVQNAVELTQYLMEKYNIPIERVCRHYDVTGKYCPAPMVYNIPPMTTWAQFLERVKDMGLTQKEVETIVNSATAPLKTRLDSAEKEIQALKRTYNTIEEVPEWYREAVQYYVNAGIIKGTGGGKLGLTETKCWALTVLYRERTDKTELD